MNKKASILIDGSNFYFKLKSVGLENQLKLSFSKLTNYLIKNKYIVYEQIYYVGAIKTDGTEKARKYNANQQKLLAHLRLNNYIYKLGYLLKTNKKYIEKGVDVNIATDILIQSYEKNVNRIYLISSDSDLIPAIHQAKKLGIEIIYVGFHGQISNALQRETSKTIVLTKNDISEFQI